MLSESIIRTSNSFVYQHTPMLDRAAGGMGLVTLPRVNTIPLTFCWAFGGSLISEVSNLQGASICRVQSGYRDPHAASHAFLVEWETECRVSKAVREAGVFPLMLRGQCVDVSGV